MFLFLLLIDLASMYVFRHLLFYRWNVPQNVFNIANYDVVLHILYIQSSSWLLRTSQITWNQIILHNIKIFSSSSSSCFFFTLFFFFFPFFFVLFTLLNFRIFCSNSYGTISSTTTIVPLLLLPCFLFHLFVLSLLPFSPYFSPSNA